MTSPRGTYGGGYYSSPAIPDTPIYDSLVRERGTPQIAPIRVPSAYETGSNLPALPALPPAPMHTPAQGTYTGYPSAPQPAVYPQALPLQPAPGPYLPQQASAPRGYVNGSSYQGQSTTYQNGGYQNGGYQNGGYQNGGYDSGAIRPVPPRPAPPRPAPVPYEDQYRRPYPAPGY